MFVEHTERPVRPRLLLAAVLAAVGAAYTNSIAGPFIWDDVALVVRQPLVHRLTVAEHFTSAFWTRSAIAQAITTYYRPVTSITYALDWWRSGGRPGAFHMTNVALHLTVCALVFSLCLRAGAKPAVAAVATATFGLMPRLTESVAWISGRTDLLAAAGALTFLRLHFALRRTHWKAALGAVALLLGLLAKEVALAALVGAAAAELSPTRERTSVRAAAARLAPASAAAALYFTLRWSALRSTGAAELPSFDHRWLMPVQALGSYAWMTVDALRPRLRIGWLGTLELPLLALGIASAVVIAGVTVQLARRRPSPLTWALWTTALSALALVLHLVRINVQVVAADRFLYLPYAAGAPLIAAALANVELRRRTWAWAWAWAAWGLVACALFSATMYRNEDWADEVRLWRRAVATAPAGDLLPDNELGNALARAGQEEDALRVYQSVAVRARGEGQLAALGNVAATFLDLGRCTEARELFAELARHDPGCALHFYNLARTEACLRRFDAADALLDRAIALVPGYPEATRVKEIIASARAVLDTPARPDESPPDVAKRAIAWSQLGAFTSAGPLWRHVAVAPDAGVAELTQAAAFLASRGTPEEAHAAVTRARQAGGRPGDLEEIEAVLDERETRGRRTK